jgi:hypothetical protein
MRCNAYIWSSHQQGYTVNELKVVLLHLWQVNVKTIGGFINIPLADLAHINLRHNNITTLLVGRDNSIITDYAQ